MRHFLPIVLAGLMAATAARGDLHDPNNSADYLIVTSDEVAQANHWIADLSQWRSGHGRTAMVVVTEEIFNEFGSGTPSDTVLKEFLHYARTHWQPPQLRDVFIIGFHDVVPSHVEPDSMSYVDSTGVHWSRCYHLTDFFFATDPDSDNYLPVLSIGRLPWSPTMEEPLWDFFAKIEAYETAPQSAWQTRVHLIADFSDEVFTFWQTYAEPLASEVAPGYTFEKDYVDFPEGDPWHGDRDEIFANFNAGSYLSCYAGHGGAGHWSGELNLTASFFDSLTNGLRLPIIMHTSYDLGMNGNYLIGDILTSFLSNRRGGAIAYFGPSSYVWYFASLEFNKRLVRLATGDSVTVLGDVWRLTEREYVTANHGGFGVPGSPTQQTAFGCMLFGDPGLRLPGRSSAADEPRVGPPDNIQLLSSYPNPFNSSAQITFELAQTARVSLRIVDLTGRQVATLADELRAAGKHVVTWDASGLPSGMYFAVMQAGAARKVHKMVLLK